MSEQLKDYIAILGVVIGLSYFAIMISWEIFEDQYRQFYTRLCKRYPFLWAYRQRKRAKIYRELSPYVRREIAEMRQAIVLQRSRMQTEVCFFSPDINPETGKGGCCALEKCRFYRRARKRWYKTDNGQFLTYDIPGCNLEGVIYKS